MLSGLEPCSIKEILLDLRAEALEQAVALEETTTYGSVSAALWLLTGSFSRLEPCSVKDDRMDLGAVLRKR